MAHDATTGDNLEGVEVTLEGEAATYTGTTDSDGRVDLGMLPAANAATLTATLEGYVPFNRTYTVPEGVEEEGFYFNLSPQIELVIKALSRSD